MSKINEIFQDQSKSGHGFTQTKGTTSRKPQATHETIIVSCVDLLKEMGDAKIVKKSKFMKKTKDNKNG